MEIKGKEGCIKGKRGEVRLFESYQSDAMSKKAKKTLFMETKYILLVRAVQKGLLIEKTYLI